MKILFFDSETTGLPKNWKAPVEQLDNWPRLVQIAWQVYDSNGDLLEEHEYIIKPIGFTIPSEASDVHKITTEKALETGEDLLTILNIFSSSVKGCGLLVAHNYSYDYNIMGSELLRNGLENSLKDKEHLCTMKASTEFCKIPGPHGYKWPKLEELYDILFRESFNAHDALDDIRATARSFWALQRMNILNITFILNLYDFVSKIPEEVLNEKINYYFIFAHTNIYLATQKITLSDETNKLLNIVLNKIKHSQIKKRHYILSSHRISYAGKIEHLIFYIYFLQKIVDITYSYDYKLIINEISIFLNTSLKIALLKLGYEHSNDHIESLIETRISLFDEIYNTCIEEFILNDIHNLDSSEYNYYLIDLHNRHIYPHLYYLMFFSPLKNVIVEDYKFGFYYINECKDVYENVEVKKIASVYPNIDNLEDLFSGLNFTIEDHWLISLSKK